MLVKADNYLIIKLECKYAWLALTETERNDVTDIYKWVDAWCFDHDYRMHPILKEKLVDFIKEV